MDNHALSTLIGSFAVAAFFTTPSIANENYSIDAHTGAAGGLYMEPTVVWVEQWREEIPELSVAPMPGGSMTNPINVSNAGTPWVMGWTTLPLARQSMEGTGEYASRVPNGIKNLRALWRVNALTWADIIARPGVVPDGVSTLGEFFATEPDVHWILKSKGSGAESMMQKILEVYDLSYDDLEEWGKVSFMDTADGARMLIDGHADIYVNALPMPDSNMLDMDASVPNLKWLAIDKEQADLLASEHGYISDEHPTGAYDSLKSGLHTVAYDHVVFVREEMDEEIVYKVTKTILGNPERTQGMPQLSDFDPELGGTQTVFPLHAGAERAYEELGLK